MIKEKLGNYGRGLFLTLGILAGAAGVSGCAPNSTLNDIMDNPFSVASNNIRHMTGGDFPKEKKYDPFPGTGITHMRSTDGGRWKVFHIDANKIGREISCDHPEKVRAVDPEEYYLHECENTGISTSTVYYRRK